MRILLVEDDADLAELASDALALGRHSVTHACSVEHAFLALTTRMAPDAAVLDVNVGEKTVFDVADHLDALGVPFLFASAASRAQIPDRFAKRQLLRKPYKLERLLSAIRELANPYPNRY